MIARHLVYCATAVTIAAAPAAPTDDALAAAMKLSAATNYAWTTKIEQNGRTAEIRGQTGGSAYSLLTFTGFSAPASPGGTATNAVFLGNDKYVIETSQGWIVPAGVNAPSLGDDSSASRNNNSRGSSARSGSSSGGMRSRGGASSRGGAGGIGGGTGRGRSSESESDKPAVTSAPRLPSAINLPHEELAFIATNSTDLRFENGVLSGKLTPEGADLLLAPPGAAQRAPKGAAGTFRLWVQNGTVTKYELKLTAESAPGNSRANATFSETITTEPSKVDNTRFTAPAAAKAKLGY